MDEVMIFCHLCGGLFEPWADRAEWDKRLAHAACVVEQDEPLDIEWMEENGYDE